MGALATALAACFTILVARKLPGVKGLVERGKKPWACDVCSSAWTSLGFVLFDAVLVDPKPSFGWRVYVALLPYAAYVAALAFVMLTTYQWAKMLVGWKDPDDVKPSDYQPPGA